MGPWIPAFAGMTVEEKPAQLGQAYFFSVTLPKTSAASV